MTDTITLNRTLFERAAELIRTNGFWDGTHDESRSWSPARGYCIGLALVELPNVSGVDKDVAMDHLAAQLGYDPDADPAEYNGSSHGFIFDKNDEYAGRPEEGKAWALDVLDKLARGESLV